MTTITSLMAGVLASALWAATAVAEGKLPMPPTFSAEADRMEVLESYPLGVITQQAAFSHHGKASLEVELPNGLEGWVYEVGRSAEKETYKGPSGQRETVTETRHRRGTRLYTLVFSADGKVVDVLYNEHGRHDGLTALQAQQNVMEQVMEADPGRGTVE